jgi:drug/metabolite transporter (DMT)-like permease
MGFFEMKAWKMEHFKMFLIPTTIFTLMLFCSLQALPYIAVATTIIFRNISTVLVATGDYFFFSKAFTFQQRVAMGVILCGSVVYAGNDVNYEPIGYFWITLNTLFFSGNMLVESWAVKEIDQTPVGISCYQVSNLLLLTLAHAPLSQFPHTFDGRLPSRCEP